MALTELAEKTIDVQYYIWEPDDTGRILAERLMRAADRGVRVRVLLDDISFEGRDTITAGLDPATEQDLQAARAILGERIAAADYPYPLDQDIAELKSVLQTEIDRFVWAPGRIVWDDPAEIVAAGGTSRMLEGLHQRAGRLGHLGRVTDPSADSNDAYPDCRDRRPRSESEYRLRRC